MDRECKGIWIPIEVWEDRNLSWNEKILLMEIDSFTKKGQTCFFSDDYISEMLGINKSNANRTLGSLIKKGYVKKIGFDGRLRYVQSCLAEISRAGLLQMAEQGYQSQQHTNIDSNTSTKSICNKEHRFQKPSVEEVRIYCQERQNSVDPEVFINHYESNGWMVGKSHMKDWKAAVRTWEQREKAQRPAFRSAPGTQQRESVIQSYQRVRQNIFGYGNQVDDQ